MRALGAALLTVGAVALASAVRPGGLSAGIREKDLGAGISASASAVPAGPVDAGPESSGAVTMLADFSTQTGCQSSPFVPDAGPSVYLARTAQAMLEWPAGTLTLCGTVKMRYGGGLLIERTFTNNVLRSEALDNASWTKNFATCSTPTVAANNVVAPDGNTSAETVTYPACSGTSRRTMMVPTGPGTATPTMSVWTKSASADAGIDLNSYGSASCGDNVSRVIPGTTWARTSWAILDGTFGGTFGVGYNNVSGCVNSATSIVSQAVPIWGFQSELSGYRYPTSYIRTDGTAVQRDADVVTFVSTGLFGTKGSGSIKVTLPFSSAQVDAALNANARAFGLFSATGFTVQKTATGGVSQVTLTIGNNSSTATTPTVTWDANTTHTISFRWKEGDRTCITWDSDAEVCGTSSDAINVSTDVTVGKGATVVNLNATVVQVKFCAGYGVCT